jgi:putative tricarboxylic transport membrane protein
MQKRLETAVVGSLLLFAVAFLAFVDAFVAKPKMLFGRSLSAIEPTSFPLIAMVMMIVLCGLFFYLRFRETSSPEAVDDEISAGDTDWLRIGAFFLVLLFYALTFDRFGFLSSTFLSMMFISLLAGNRNLLQMTVFSAVLPLAFYLLATRVLLVSLPELSSLELIIAKSLGN